MNSVRTTIKFKQVGRANRTWTRKVDFDNPVMLENYIYRQIRRNGGLASIDVGFSVDLKTGEGSICAGFHTVGEIEVEFDKTVDLSIFKGMIGG